MFTAFNKHSMFNERDYMMETIRTYLLSVVSAAIICALVMGIVGNKSSHSTVVKLLTGLFLSITVISPLTDLTIGDMTGYFSGLQAYASNLTSEGLMIANTATASIIIDQTEAYILDKATSLGADLDVKVSLTNDAPPVPKSVIISGTIAPYTKKQLEEIIANDLAIPKEKQSWI